MQHLNHGPFHFTENCLGLLYLNELLSASLLYLEAWETGLTNSGNGIAMTAIMIAPKSYSACL